MNLDWAAFTPAQATAGGLLIGAAAVLLMAGAGRIAGISGILGGLLRPVKGDLLWRIAFLLGLMAAPLVFVWFRPLPAVTIEASNVTLVVAGLLVGLGTRYGAGCTSGHGVCGLSRLSLRSLVATMSFMAAGFLTVYIVRHLIA